MDLNFERGRADAPAGHALVYFRGGAGGETLATYLVVLPVALQLSKYVPPMFAAQLPMGDLKDLSAVPLPPIPEAVESQPAIEHLADLRRDDLIAGGTLNPNDVMRAMALVAEIARRYAELYEQYLQRSPTAPPEPEPDVVSEATMADVLYGLMSEQQKLAELAKLAGQLQYAADGGDRAQVEELAAEVGRLAQYFPASYDLPSFIAAARQSGPAGRQLAALYLDRCYKLASEDYAALAAIDREIARLRQGTGS
jgi:hypothetical protein